jgi:hypothetical protein
MSLRTIRRYLGPLMLVTAALSLHVSSALAADSSDAQERARQVLLGVTFVPQSTQHPARKAKAGGDAQESARQLLRGGTVATTRQLQPAVARAHAGGVREDAQLQARGVLLGMRTTTGS